MWLCSRMLRWPPLWTLSRAEEFLCAADVRPGPYRAASLREVEACAGKRKMWQFERRIVLPVLLTVSENSQ
jgi:hypothetical protein